MEREIVFALAAGEWKNLDDVLELKLTWAILPDACGAPENDSDLPSWCRKFAYLWRRGSGC